MIRTCPVCGKEYEGRAKYCSDDCRQAAKAQNESAETPASVSDAIETEPVEVPASAPRVSLGKHAVV